MGILEVVQDHDAETRSPASPVNVAVVFEDEVVIEDLGDYMNAFSVLICLLYALDIQYPKKLRYTFEAVQKVFLLLGNPCSNRVLSLKNMLSAL